MPCLDTDTIVFALDKRWPAVRARLMAEQAVGTATIVPVIVSHKPAYGIAKSSRLDRSQSRSGRVPVHLV